MKILLKILLIFFATNLIAQEEIIEALGFRHLQTVYNNDTVDILIKSKEGESEIPKPLFLFCQGSLPSPLVKYSDEMAYGVFPFFTETLCEQYHLVIISKPFIPVVSEVKLLEENYTYIDSLGNFPKEYSERNYLDYYVYRNICVLKYLRKLSWVLNDKLVIAGHSEGSTIAAKISLKYPKVTHLIYSGGNPMGRICSMVGQHRQSEQFSDTTSTGEQEILYWQWVVKNKTSLSETKGDTGKATFDFSIPPIQYLEKLKIPVLVCYGTKDLSAPFIDYMRIDFIRKERQNFYFKAYIGTEHNYFPVTQEGQIDYSIYNWDDVANYWTVWLNEK